MKRSSLFTLLLLIGVVSGITLSLLTRLNLTSMPRIVTTTEPSVTESPAPTPVPTPAPVPAPVPAPAPAPDSLELPRSLPPRPNASPPSRPPRFPIARVPRPVPTLRPADLQSAENAVNAALAKLPQGQVYHNVPEQMKVNVAEVIEAGIAPEVTDKIKQELQGKGQLEVQSNVQFDPSGMEMQLVVKPDEFEVFEVKGGKQFVTSSTPGKWIWQVTPLQPGDRLIVVKAIVDLKVPELDVTRPIEVEVFRATRKVEVNPAYSLGLFLSSNWREITGLMIGSGSLVSLISWWNSRKLKQPES